MKPSPSRCLAAHPLFAHVDATTLARFDTDDHWLYLSGGQVLFRQGDQADALYIVVRGSLQVILEHEDGSERLMDTLGVGALVGEMALLLGDTRTATVAACRNSELIRIGKAEFDRLIEDHPSIAVEIARTLGARLKRTTRFTGTVPRVRTIALLPVTPGAVSSNFGERLAAALGEGVCHMTTALADRLKPGAADADSRDEAGHGVLEWMNQLEDQFRYVIYETDPARPAWTRRCLQDADATLLVAHAGDDPARGEVERTLLPDGARPGPIELVLLHGAGDGPDRPIRDTARWLEGRRVVRHHHVRIGCDDDNRRVARFLAGRAVGLVLSGGGARGLAHIGVIKALKAHGWPIDLIGGASMGAIIAAQFAAGHDADVIREVTGREFGRRRGVKRDVTVPMASLFTAESTVQKMKRLFGDANIEDLPIGYFCTSTNLTRAQTVVHDRGPVWLAARTSCALPGLAPPVPRDGDLLVDGGLLNNLPADVMRRRCNGIVIGVDVTPGIDLQGTVETRPYVSGWPLLWERLTGSGRTTFPSIVDILSRTALVASIRDAASMRVHCDLYLEPPVERFGMSDFGEMDALVEAGFRTAEAAIAASGLGA